MAYVGDNIRKVSDIPEPKEFCYTPKLLKGKQGTINEKGEDEEEVLPIYKVNEKESILTVNLVLLS